MRDELLIDAIILSGGLVLFIAMMSQVQTRAGKVLSFSIALTLIIVATTFVFGFQQSLLGVVVAAICPLLGSAAAMRALNSQGVSPLTRSIGAFLGGAAGAFVGFYVGLMAACLGGDC
jgi:hypothetical protein